MRSLALVALTVVVTLIAREGWVAVQGAPVAAQVTPAPTPTPTSVPTPIPTPVWTPALPSPYPTLDRKRVVISAVGSDDVDPKMVATVLGLLPDAWSKATRGRSSLVLVPGSQFAPIYLTFNDLELRQPGITVTGLHGRLAGDRIQVIDIYRHPRGSTTETIVLTILHELGHAFGCCYGEGAAGGHWTDCDVELMCRLHLLDRQSVFSDRELAAMGLGG